MMSSFNLFAVSLILTIVVAAVGVHASTDHYKGNETPAYQVISAEGPVELRRYAPYLVAEVEVAGDRGGAIRAGFRVLADYIFGGNAEGRKIEMTVPVSQLPAQDNWNVRFMMPSAYSLETLPAARNEAIRFFETEPQDHLVLRFSGAATSDMLAARADELLALARARGYERIGQPQFHFYDDPLTLPWNRRNEVSVPLS